MDFVNAASAGPVADSTITVAHDCGSGDDRWLFVAVPLFSAGETPTVATVTYDGAALSPVVQGSHLYAGNGNVVRAEWWALDLVAAGKTGSAERFYFARGFGLVAWASDWGQSAISEVGVTGDNQRERICGLP